MIKVFSSLLASAYLGFSLGCFANIGYNQWQFYAIIIPTIALFNIAVALPKNK